MTDARVQGRGGGTLPQRRDGQRRCYERCWVDRRHCNQPFVAAASDTLMLPHAMSHESSVRELIDTQWCLGVMHTTLRSSLSSHTHRICKRHVYAVHNMLGGC